MTDMQPTKTNTIAAVILAGGKSRRFNQRDKGLIPFLDKPMVQHVIERLLTQTNGIAISCNQNIEVYRSILRQHAPQKQNLTQLDLQQGQIPECIEDLKHIPLIGPLAGIYAFLSLCPSEHVFICPCDIPLIPFDIVQQLELQLKKSAADVCYPVDERGQHHLIVLAKREAAVNSLNELITANNTHANSDERINGPISAIKTKHFSIKNWLATLKCSQIGINSKSLGLANINSAAEMAQLTQQFNDN